MNILKTIGAKEVALKIWFLVSIIPIILQNLSNSPLFYEIVENMIFKKVEKIASTRK